MTLTLDPKKIPGNTASDRYLRETWREMRVPLLRADDPQADVQRSLLLWNASPCIQDVMRFALNTGLRIEEIFTLRWSDVDWENTVLNIFAPQNSEAAGRADER